MEKKYGYIPLVLTVYLAGVACIQEMQYPRPASATPIIPPPSETNTLTITPTETMIPKPTETIIPTPTLDQRFVLGRFDTQYIPFTLQLSDSLNSDMSFIPSANRVLTADIPQPIKGPYFGNFEQFETFEGAATNNSEGNPYYVFTTSEANHVLVYFHSITSDSAGEAIRKIGKYVIQNPEKVDKILGQTITITPKDQALLVGEIVDLNIVSREYFFNADKNAKPFGKYPDGENVLFARTDLFGISDEIRNDRTPGVYYLTIAACISKDGNISLFKADNIAQRILVTLKITQ
ncbi:MAG TPA: hypothetical protein VFI61_01655 [Patescibacteria group bacterium]|nr:hypothetical protein [Patescibacteria group bacterium]